MNGTIAPNRGHNGLAKSVVRGLIEKSRQRERQPTTTEPANLNTEREVWEGTELAAKCWEDAVLTA